MAVLKFYFDFRSPYAYLAQSRLQGLGVEVDFVRASLERAA